MKRIATLLALLTVTSIASVSFAAGTAPATVNQNGDCVCSNTAPATPESFKDFLNRTEQMLP